MDWLLGFSKDIAVDVGQIEARVEFIRCVTGADVTAWQHIRVNGKTDSRYLRCTSADEVNGVFITAHVQDVFNLCNLRQIRESNLIVANTCIWDNLAHKELLRRLRISNPTAELYFAMQELSVDFDRTFRQTTTLLNVGNFGFLTSLSERELFKNRHLGFAGALKESFKRVSPVYFIGE